MTNPQHTTNFEPLAKLGRTDRPGWFAFMAQGGWHVSIFPKGPKGKRTFDEFHVTKEEDFTGNKHHFYTDDGHVQVNHLDNVAFTETDAWTYANTMAARFYQTKLGLYVTPEMLQEEVKSFKRRTARVLTMEEYWAVQANQRKPTVPAPKPTVPYEDIDMFDLSEPGTTLTGTLTTASPSGPPTTTAPPSGPPSGPPTPVPPGPPVAVPHPTPAVAPPEIVLPQTALELYQSYERYLNTLAVDDDVRRRWSDALVQLYSRLGKNASVAELKVLFDGVFTCGLSV